MRRSRSIPSAIQMRIARQARRSVAPAASATCCPTRSATPRTNCAPSSPTLERRELGRFHQIIARALDYNPTWLTVILADPSGKQVLNARLGPSADLPTTVEPESFDLATRTRRPLVGYLARGGGDFAVPVRVPVMRNGELRYVLTAAGQPDRLRDLLNRQRVT